MERHTGWKPMPLVFKIIWILLLIQTVSALMGVFSVAKVGYTFCGFEMYGLWAANTMFIVSIVLPVILLIAMMRRTPWAWIYGAFYYVLAIVNGLFIFRSLGEVIRELIKSIPPEVLDKVPNPQQLIYQSAVAGLVLGASLNVFFMLMFFIKRKYFTAAEPQLPIEKTEGSGGV